MNDGMDYRHICGRLDYESVYMSLLRGATVLAEKGEYEYSRELASTAIGLQTELDACDTETDR